MLNLSLLQQMLMISITVSTVTCAFIQKTKGYFKCSNCLSIYSLIINIAFGVIFCISFTKIKFPESLWIGLFSFLGANTIYKSLEGKIASHTDIRAKKNNTTENKDKA